MSGDNALGTEQCAGYCLHSGLAHTRQGYAKLARDDGDSDGGNRVVAFSEKQVATADIEYVHLDPDSLAEAVTLRGSSGEDGLDLDVFGGVGGQDGDGLLEMFDGAVDLDSASFYVLLRGVGLSGTVDVVEALDGLVSYGCGGLFAASALHVGVRPAPKPFVSSTRLFAAQKTGSALDEKGTDVTVATGFCGFEDLASGNHRIGRNANGLSKCTGALVIGDAFPFWWRGWRQSVRHQTDAGD